MLIRRAQEHRRAIMERQNVLWPILVLSTHFVYAARHT